MGQLCLLWLTGVKHCMENQASWPSVRAARWGILEYTIGANLDEWSQCEKIQSFPRMIEENIPTDKISVWRRTRKTAGGYNVEDGAAGREETIDRRLDELPREEQTNHEVRDRIFEDVVGHDGHGRVHCMGVGVRPNPIRMRSSSHFYENQIAQLREEAEEREVRYRQEVEEREMRHQQELEQAKVEMRMELIQMLQSVGISILEHTSMTSLHFLRRCISTIFDVLLPRSHTPSFKQHRSPGEDSSYKLSVSKTPNFKLSGALKEKIEIMGTNATVMTLALIEPPLLKQFTQFMSQRISHSSGHDSVYSKERGCVLLLDFVHSWNDKWVGYDEKFWHMALLVVLVSGIILPASVISLYCTYLCYSGLASEPGDYACIGLHKHSKVVSTGTLSVGLLTTVLSVVYSTVRDGSSTTLLSPPSSPRAGQYSQSH
ncbi:hypothetical protein LguiA_012687 [Lonicera macranthoides]